MSTYNAQLMVRSSHDGQFLLISNKCTAGLVPEVTSSIYEKTPYNDADHESLADELWGSINIDAGIVALSDDYAKEKNLPIAQRFPWDKTKGIYLLNGYHHLHCLVQPPLLKLFCSTLLLILILFAPQKSIYGAVREYRQGLPQSRPAAHVTHCLDALRREIICDADDTPRATTREYSPNTGVGQFRQCRSWEKLEQWAVGNTACYSYVDPSNSTKENLERFKFCPKGSEYWDAVKKVYPDAGP